MERLFILDKGLVMRKARIMRSPNAFGEEVVVANRMSTYGVISLSHVRCLSISRAKIQAVLQKHPEMIPIVRKNALHDIMRDKV